MIDLVELDAVGTTPRMPMVMEMVDAAMHTLDRNLPTEVRLWWAGVHAGYQVGFGLTNSASEVRWASCFRSVDPDAATPTLLLSKLTRYDHTDRCDISYASGVLYGYKQSTSERQDAVECGDCGQRICLDLDESVTCNCVGVNYFCDRPDCFVGFPHAASCEARYGEDA